ncbi:MAG: FMN-binding glutamate synthase family protein [Candidatus Lokiarchaeota archaeon]|nr:FMN-binding glutamate synthase family protein [Candidatus Lokiarchaeota archaeon]MBD3337865.1 FMN-binding glutamate synthase family protein [Candidatus Lokiarchaeota archaeon]
MTKFSMVTHRNSMVGARTRVEDSCESGLCPICIADCPIFCEVSKSALRGREVLYPLREYFGDSTAGTPKDFGFSYADFQIQFEVRGAKGLDEIDEDQVIFPNADVSTKWGNIDQKLPVVIAGLGSTYVAKRNWEGLAMGSALAGVSLTVGENVVGMDPNAKFVNGGKYPKVVDTEDMKFRVESFRKYWDGKHGDIIVQKNVEDTRLGVFDYVTSKLEIDSLEIKFGQGAKAIGGEVRLHTLERAQLLQERGYLVIPDPSDPVVIEQWKEGLIPDFERHSRVGLSSTEEVLEEIDRYRSNGAKNVFIKTGAYRPSATAWIIRLGVEGKVDGMTFDGAGGGTGMSPVSMMNEGSIPTAYLQALVVGCLDMIKQKEPNAKIPTIAMAGGFANETQIFKSMAMGAPYITCIAMARAPITAAMKAKYVGEVIDERAATPSMLNSLGFPRDKEADTLTLSEAFVEYDALMRKYDEAIPPAAIGVYTYFKSKLGVGLKQLLAGGRKFKLDLLSRDDIACISQRAIDVCNYWNLGINSQEKIDIEQVKNEIYSGHY